jgi:D-alanyl-D-alanine dipeptidase
MALEKGFVYLSDIDGSIIQDIKYASRDNITGRIIKSYQAQVCITLEVIAKALASIQNELIDKSYSLKIFDCYRPQTATDDFINWSQDNNDQLMKSLYYPSVAKSDLFNLGYFSKTSAHTRGSAVDLTIVDLNTRDELDMGTRFDFMDETSNPLSEKIVGDAKENRMLLRNLMLKAGFEPVQSEWWHFRYINEPFPDTYFDFPVK